MNKLERFKAFSNFESVDRVPRAAGYVKAMQEKMTDFLGKDPHLFFDTDGGSYVRLTPPEGYIPYDYSAYFPDYEVGKADFSIDINGCGHKGCGFYHFSEFISPLRDSDSFEDIETFHFVDLSDWSSDKMCADVKEIHKRGDYVAVFAGHMYESAWQVRGYEPFLMDMAINPDWAEYILEKFHKNNMRIAIEAAKAGVDCLRTGDDIANQNAMMFQPDLWRKMIKSRWAKVYAAAKAIKPDIKIWYHSDGNIEAVLDDLVEIGVDILNPLQPECVDPVAIRKRYGKKLAFDGCIGTQTTFPFGTPADMKKAVEDISDALDGKNGGLMLAPTHVLEPEVTPENVIAFFETCDSL